MKTPRRTNLLWGIIILAIAIIVMLRVFDVLRAAEYASRQKEPGPAVVAQGEDERRRLVHGTLQRTDGRERIATVREAMQKTMEESAGIYRSGGSLGEAADKLRELQGRYANVAIEDASRTFNTELTAAVELSFMLDVAESIVQSALGLFAGRLCAVVAAPARCHEECRLRAVRHRLRRAFPRHVRLRPLGPAPADAFPGP